MHLISSLVSALNRLENKDLYIMCTKFVLSANLYGKREYFKSQNSTFILLSLADKLSTNIEKIFFFVLFLKCTKTSDLQVTKLFYNFDPIPRLVFFCA